MNQLSFSSLEHRRLLRRPYLKPAPALFLDRDGVLIEDRQHLCDPDQVQLCPGALQLLEAANARDWPVVLITNQSGIARGYFGWDAYERVTDRLLELLGPLTPIAAIYASGHGPNSPATSWRKPSPAMLLAAATDLHLDLSRSLLVGDRLTDLLAGSRGGLNWLGHVTTGHGQWERDAVEIWSAQIQDANKQNHSCDVVLLETLHDFPVDRLHRI